MTHPDLTLRAGPTALRQLRERGFDPDLFTTMIGASGGAKWLVLSQLDRVLIESVIEPRSAPLDLIGSSIGSFRHACLVQSDPRGAIERFEQAYITQVYESRPTRVEVSGESLRILDIVLGEKGRREIVHHPDFRSHVIAARLGGSLGLRPSLAAAALGNLVTRSALGWVFERALFSSAAPGPSLRFENFDTVVTPLSESNVDRAILASGTIPFVMEAVRDIEGAPDGLYFDGGLLDYHFDFAFAGRPGLVLYPHFFEHITPGWLDKNLRWRRIRGAALDRVVLISPSAAFQSRLPGGGVPDRGDFERWGTEERQRNWWQTVDACRALADSLHELIATGRIVDAIEPF